MTAEPNKQVRPSAAYVRTHTRSVGQPGVALPGDFRGAHSLVLYTAYLLGHADSNSLVFTVDTRLPRRRCNKRMDKGTILRDRITADTGIQL